MSSKPLSTNELVILAMIKRRKQTIYQMGTGDASMITGLTLMAIHKICGRLEQQGLITSESKADAGGKGFNKVISKQGLIYIKSVSEAPFDGVPISFTDFYILDTIKSNAIVHEALVFSLSKAKRKVIDKDVKGWIDYAINRYQ